jgi:hypothetical protein
MRRSDDPSERGLLARLGVDFFIGPQPLVNSLLANADCELTLRFMAHTMQPDD